MQKVVKDNIIYVEKPKMSVLPLVLSAASLLFVALGAASLFYFQKPLQEGQDIRQQASVASGQVQLTSQVTSSQIYQAGAPTTIDLRYNSQGVQLSGIQIVTRVTANSETPLITVPSSSPFQAIFQEVEQVSGGYLVSVIITPKTIGTSFSSTSPTTFAQIQVPLRAAGQISLVYDRANSFATVANTSPPRDELRTPEDVTYSIIAAAASPSPSPSVTPSPSVSPAVTPSPSSSPNASVIPTGDDFWLRSDGVYLRFFTDDSARTEVAMADLQPNRSYVVRVQYQVQNARKSSATNLTPVQTAFVFNGQGSSYVTDTLPYSLISAHADGASDSVETKFTTQADNSLRMTVDANSSYAETNEGNNVLIYEFPADNGVGGLTGLQRTCNEYCADSRECAANYTCFFNRCRRPDNPDSSTCVAATATVTTTIANSCNTTCDENRDCAVNLRCYQGVCRLATNLSSLSCSPATAGVISNGSGTGLKGDDTPQPTVSPRPSLSPSTSPVSSVSPTSSPSIYDLRPEDATGSSLISRFLSGMQERGISVPVIAVVIGLLLFVLALIFAVLGRTNNRPPMVVTTRKEPPKTVFEDDLQKKINALKSKPVAEPVQPAAIAPMTPEETTPKPPTVQTPPVTVKPETASETPESNASAMMSRLRERGVLDNKPGTSSQAESTPPETTVPEEQPPKTV